MYLHDVFLVKTEGFFSSSFIINSSKVGSFVKYEVSDAVRWLAFQFCGVFKILIFIYLAENFWGKNVQAVVPSGLLLVCFMTSDMWSLVTYTKDRC